MMVDMPRDIYPNPIQLGKKWVLSLDLFNSPSFNVCKVGKENEQFKPSLLEESNQEKEII